MAEDPPKISQFLWQLLQELPKIDPEGLWEASFDQYLILARCRTLKNRVSSAQERPQEAPKTTKNCSRALRRGPRPAQTLPKWGPRPFQKQRLGCFFGFMFPSSVCSDFVADVSTFFALVLVAMFVCMCFPTQF